MIRIYRVEVVGVEERFVFIGICIISWLRFCGLFCFFFSFVIYLKIRVNKYIVFNFVIGVEFGKVLFGGIVVYSD